MAENHKFLEPWSSGTVHSQTEALEQLNKAGNLLGDLNEGYGKLGRAVPDIKQVMKDGLEIVGNRNLAPAVREAQIKALGYRSMEDFAKKVTSQFEFFKLY